MSDKTKAIIRIILAVISAAAAVACVIALLMRLNDYRKEDRTRSEVSEMMASHTISEEDVSLPIDKAMPLTKLTDIEEIRKVNPDTYGKLTIPGTEIEDLVMRSEDDEKYLHHDFHGNDSLYGCLYTTVSTDLSSPNFLIQGHHMKNGAMFSPILKYTDAGFRDEHETILFQSEDTIYTYKVAAAFSLGEEETDLFGALSLTDEKSAELISQKAQRDGALYQTIPAGSRYITLATCEYTHKNGRFIVIGVLDDELYLRTK